MSKFRTPRIKAGVQNKLYCLCSLGTVSHSYQFWKFVGKLPKSQFPDVSQGLSLQQAFPKIAFSQIAVSCLRQLTVLTFLCTSSIMDWSSSLSSFLPHPLKWGVGGGLGGTWWGPTVWHMELWSLFCGSLNGRGVYGRCTCMYGWVPSLFTWSITMAVLLYHNYWLYLNTK